MLGVENGVRAVRLRHAHGATEAAHAIFCTGAWADRTAVLAGADPDPRIVPFRGAYLRLAPAPSDTRALAHLPVPDPVAPVPRSAPDEAHDGEVLIGPSALPVGARDGYGLRTLRPRDARETLTWPGSWRMARRWWRTGITEVHHVLSPASLVRAAARYIPELRPGDAATRFRRGAGAGGGPRRAPHRRLRLLAHGTRAARSQRAFAGGERVARDRAGDRGPRRRGLRLAVLKELFLAFAESRTHPPLSRRGRGALMASSLSDAPASPETSS